MIWESSYWKTDLLKQVAALKKRVTQKRWTEASLAKCEQNLMMGFYSVRKLIESLKLTDIVADSSYQIRSYPPTGKRVTLLNNHKIDELYDLGAPRKETIKLKDLCNQFIHSYVFAPVVEGGGLSAIWLASDRQRSKALIEVTLATVIEVFEVVGNDEVDSARYTFNPKKGDYRTENRVEPSLVADEKAAILRAVSTAEISIARGEGRAVTQKSMRQLAGEVKRRGRSRLARR
jgi:hypothetical protein